MSDQDFGTDLVRLVMPTVHPTVHATCPGCGINGERLPMLTMPLPCVCTGGVILAHPINGLAILHGIGCPVPPLDLARARTELARGALRWR